MRRYRAASVLIVLLALPLYAQAAPAPIVFDFEDGTTQGWSLGYQTFLTPTRGIFGEGDSTAVFGSDGSSMSIELDLTNIASMTWEEFDLTLPPGSRDPQPFAHLPFAHVMISPGNSPRLDLLRGGVPLSSTNPLERSFDLSAFTGTQEIRIQWELLLSIPGPQAPIAIFPGYINTVTFHPVPEPGTLALLAVSLAAIGLYLGRARVRLRSDPAQQPPRALARGPARDF